MSAVIFDLVQRNARMVSIAILATLVLWVYLIAGDE